MTVPSSWTTKQVSTVRHARETATQNVFVSALLDGILKGRWKKTVERVRAAVADGDGDRAKALKETLPGAMFSGTFTKRGNEYLSEHSGILCLDFDKLNGTLPEARKKLEGDPHTAALFISPSGNGLKVLVPIPADPTLHRAAYEAAAEHFAGLGLKADTAPSALASLCFVSWDPDLFTRTYPQPFTAEPPAVKIETMKAEAKPDERKTSPPPADDLPPWTDFANRTSWAAILEPHGWKAGHIGADGNTHWTRPGKGDGTSATTKGDDGPLYVFSSNAGLPVNEGLSKQYAFALLNHAGDMKAAARALRASGYGRDSKLPISGKDTNGNETPAVILPQGEQSISDAGRALGELLAKKGRFFIRGGVPVKVTTDADGFPQLDEVRAAGLASDFEGVAKLVRFEKQKGKTEDGKDKPAKLQASTCCEQTAKLIAASTAFRESLPPIHVITRCPVLIELAGNLFQISGYDRQSGIYAAGKPAEPMDLDTARPMLLELVEDFRFATPPDRARALAAFITPALVLGGLLRGRAPVDMGEADDSQAGKGYRNKLTAAVYAQSVKTVTQKTAGVGSLEESFNMALIHGANFVALDNVRGKIDSPAIESFLTEDNYTARAPYREPVEIDPRRVVVMFTSNKADVTTDLANRSSCVRILKQPEGYIFKSYPEGDILDHVRARQPRYLGAIFAIVRAWYEAGRPRTTETRHDFRPWAQSLDWITRNLLDAGPLLDGHRETQERMTNPVLNWLRDVALQVVHAKRTGNWLRTGDMVDLLDEAGHLPPGVPEGADLTDHEVRKSAQQATGRKLGVCFRSGDTVTLDGIRIERREEYDPASRFTVRLYCFSVAADAEPQSAAPLAARAEKTAEKLPVQAEMPLVAAIETLNCGWSAASPAADKPLIAANAVDTPLIGQSFTSSASDIASIGTISRISRKPCPDEAKNAAFAIAALEDSGEVEEGEIL